VLFTVFEIPGVTVVFVLAVVHNDSEAVGGATRFFLFVEAVAFLPEENARAEWRDRWTLCAVAAFDVQANTTAWLSLIQLLDLRQML
jgi:hypothetical protein